MRNSIFKEVYRGYGIYWHGRDGYGDETNAWCNTLREYKAKIDAHIEAELAKPVPPHLAYWETVPHDERRKWRQACQYTELSAAELAYTNRPQQKNGEYA